MPLSVAKPPIIPGRRGPEKPAHGSPCNGCGFCCAAEPCGLANDLLDCHEGPCVALEFGDGRFWCGLVRNLAKHLTPHFAEDEQPAVSAFLAPMINQALGIGRGCDADDDVED